MATGALAACAHQATGSSTATSTTASATPTGSTNDACVVGTWVSESASAQPGSGIDSLSGGQGEVLTLRQDGSMSDDFTSSKQTVGRYQGMPVTAQFTGTVTGTFAAAEGNLTFTYNDPSAVSGTATINGGAPSAVPFASQRTVTDKYQCVTGGSLSVANLEGAVTHYAPQTAG